MSPILEGFYESTGIDAVYILAVTAILLLVVLVLCIISLSKVGKLKNRYEGFLRGKDAKSLEDTILASIERSERAEEKTDALEEEILTLRKNQKIAYQKMGMVKYNAFREMSGDLSYALALLDSRNNGFIINSVYTKEGGYSYIKEIINGKSAIELSEDEKAALDEATGRLQGGEHA